MILEARDMVKSRGICRKFLDIVGESQRNWRRLLLPDPLDEYDPSILDLFDSKSGSTIEEVSLKIKSEHIKDSDHFVETLQKSQESLRSIFIDCREESLQANLSYSIESFPNLVDLRIVDSVYYQDSSSRVQLVRIDKGKEVERRGSALQIFWDINIDNWDHPFSLFSNLKSLCVQDPVDHLHCRGYLIAASQTLKHLQITFVRDEDPEQVPSEVKPLEFPNLQVLETSMTERFPSYVRIPSSCKLLLSSFSFPRNLPAVSEIWMVSPDFGYMSHFWPGQLEGQCLLLETLVILSPSFQTFPEHLLLVLRRRKEVAEAGLSINGIGMLPIKKVIVSLSLFNQDQILQIQELVEELVDLATVPMKIEVEI